MMLFDDPNANAGNPPATDVQRQPQTPGQPAHDPRVAAKAQQLHSELQSAQAAPGGAPAGAAAAPGAPAHLTVGGFPIPQPIIDEVKTLSVQALQWVMQYALSHLGGGA